MANYNLTRHVDDLLHATQNLPPSFTVHLKSGHWCLNSFNAGAKFNYNHQVASLLDDIRAQRIPVDLLDLFDSEKVPFYEGHMIVEIRDHRPEDQADTFTPHRVLLQPNGETVYSDICRMSQKSGGIWTDQQALEVEARILMSTAPPLCLDPDPHLTRAVNSILRVSVPTAPPSLKRKASAMDPEETAFEKVRRAKIIQFMRPATSRPHNWKVLEAIQRQKMGITATAPTQPTVPPITTNRPATPSSVQPPSTSATPAPQPPSTTFESSKLPSASPAPRATPTPAPVQVQQPSRVATNTFPQSSPTPQPTPAPSPPKPAIPRLPSVDPHKQSASPQIRPPSSKPQPQPQHQAQAQPAAVSQQPVTVQPQQPPQQTQPTAVPIQTQPQGAHPQYPVSFQPTIPPVNFLGQPPTYLKKGPQATQITPNQQQMHLYAYQQQQLQAAVAARYGQTQQAQGIMPNGTPANINAAVRSPMVQNTQAGGNAARPSPLGGNTPQASRSPMPPAQQPGVVPGQHPQQPTTAQQMQYNFANQYNLARMAAMSQNPTALATVHALQIQAQAQQQAQQQAQTQTQSQQPSQTPQMQAATPEQHQAQAQTQVQAHPHPQTLQMMPSYPMYMNYAGQMGMNVPMQGRLHPGYRWPTTFRGPVNGMNVQPNGQQAAQMQAAQQMQRAMQQGR